MKKLASGFSFVIILFIIVNVLVVCGLGYKYYTSTQSPKTTDNNPSVDSKVGQYIYFEHLGDLYSVNTITKESKIVDNNIDSASAASGSGSSDPLNSSDFNKVAYIKNGMVWIYDGISKIKINQPDIENLLHKTFLTGWSSDLKYLLYSIGYEQVMVSYEQVIEEQPTVSKNNINETTAGMYIYSLDTQESKKISVEYSEGFIPKSHKIAILKEYFNGSSHVADLSSYDVDSEKIEFIATIKRADQLSFSSDGSKIIYSSDHTDESEDIYSTIIANIDNSNQKIIHEGKWGQYQWSTFVKGSSKDYVYIDITCADDINELCPSGGRLVFGNKKLDYINGIFGFYDSRNVITHSGDSYDSKDSARLNLTNITTGVTSILFTSPYIDSGISRINLGVSW